MISVFSEGSSDAPPKRRIKMLNHGFQRVDSEAKTIRILSIDI